MQVIDSTAAVADTAGQAAGAATDYVEVAFGLLKTYGPKLLLAIVVLLVGLRLIKGVRKMITKVFEKKGTDPTLRPFLTNLLVWALKIMLFISVASMVGIETTSLVAVLGAAGLAVGLALQGTLANFAGGVLILTLKPYVIGDLIKVGGELGVVKEVHIFNTILLSPENKTIILPNGAVSNGNITNFSKEGKIRVDLTIGVSYDSDIKKAREVLMNMMTSNELVLKDEAPLVAVSELADSSVNLAVRPWCHPDHYWDVYFGTLEEGKRLLEEAGVQIPFPQLDVHFEGNAPKVA